MAHACVIYAPDGKRWSAYLKDVLNRPNREFKVSEYDLESRHGRDSVQQSHIKIVLMTPELLANASFMEETVRVFDGVDQSSILCVLCGVVAKEVHSQFGSITSQSEQWTKVTATDTPSSISPVIKWVSDRVKANTPPPCLPQVPRTEAPRSGGEHSPSLRKEKPLPPPNKSTYQISPVPEVRENTSFPYPEPTPHSPANAIRRASLKNQPIRIYPETITKAREPVIVTFIWKAPSADAVEITVNQSKVKIKRLNPFTFRFEAPANPAGYYPMQVSQNRVSLAQDFLIYSNVDVTDMDFLVQSLGVSLADRTAMDQALLQRLKCSLPVEELHLLFRDLASSPKGKQSEKEMPTMLHVAAQYGLQEFGSRLAELPGAILAFQTRNCHGDDPVTMAEKAGHTELADYLYSYFETQETVDVIHGIYTCMYGESLHYINSSSQIHVDTHYTKQDSNYDTVHTPINEPLLESEDDNENDYISVDAYLPGRARYFVPEKLTKAKIPAPEAPKKDRSATVAALSNAVVLSAGPSGVMNPAAMGSRGQQELIDINNMVKESKISVNNAQRFFRAWQQRYGEGSQSFTERKVTLNKLRSNFATTMKAVNIQRITSVAYPDGLESDVIKSMTQDQRESGFDESFENRLSNTSSSSSGSANLKVASDSSESLGRHSSQSTPHKSPLYSTKQEIPADIPPPIPKRIPSTLSSRQSHGTKGRTNDHH